MRIKACLLGLLVLSGCDGGSESTTGGGTTTYDGGVPPVEVDCVHVGSGKDFQVGDGKEFANIGDVPLGSLAAGDTVRVFWRAAPYHEKVMLSGQGTAEQPIRFCGVPGPQGELPVLDAEGATTQPGLDFPFDGHQPRGLVIVGHQHGDQDYYRQPSHITIEGFEIRNAGPPFSFTDNHGQVTPYSSIAAGIFVERGDDITVRGCDIHDNYNGIFMGTGGDEKTICKNALIESNYIHQNGSPTEYYEHNVYNEVKGIVYQFNRFGPTRNLNGNAIKERSAGVFIRYNWVDDGAHLLDLVDAQEARDVNLPDPAFHESFVYGNVLLRGTRNAGSIVHYGGDSGIVSDYRKGTLHFYANTVMIDNSLNEDYETTGMFEASTNDEHLDVRNNIFFSVAPATELRPIVFLGTRDGLASGIFTFQNNWVTNGWTAFDPIPGSSTQKAGSAFGVEASLFGTAPGFTSAADGDYTPVADAPVIGAGVSLDDLPPVEYQYDAKQVGKARQDGATPTIGAFGP